MINGSTCLTTCLGDGYFLHLCPNLPYIFAEMAELVDAHDSKSCSFGSVGSIPTFGTKMPLSGAFFFEITCINFSHTHLLIHQYL